MIGLLILVLSVLGAILFVAVLYYLTVWVLSWLQINYPAKALQILFVLIAIVAVIWVLRGGGLDSMFQYG